MKNHAGVIIVIFVINPLTDELGLHKNLGYRTGTTRRSMSYWVSSTAAKLYSGRKFVYSYNMGQII